MSYYLIIAGPIGVGKSTLTARMQQQAGYYPLFETPDDNPFLRDFYASGAGAFEAQLTFLGQRLQQCHQVNEVLSRGQWVVQDRSIEEDCHIFPRHHYQQGLISPVQYQTYLRLYDGMVPFLPKPDLIIYLAAPTEVLRRRIQARGRAYEQDISSVYLDQQNALYEAWAASCEHTPLLRIDTAQYEDASEVYRQAMLRLGLPTPSESKAS